MNTKNKKIKYGTVEIPKGTFEPKNVKERITIFIDQDIVNDFRKRAESAGSKYQTLINQALRDFISKPSVEERLKRIERKLKVV
jgi:uncharacterized protein (DUF4415 family)